MMETIRRILESYRLFPVEIDKFTDQLYRIKSNKQTYALKKSNLTERSLPFWHNLFQLAQSYNLYPILPVYFTQSNQLFTKDGENIYYLTPWIETQSRAYSMDNVYRSLGFIHAKTRRKQAMSEGFKQQSRESFLVFKNNIAAMRSKLLQDIEQFEARHFMSPVELLVCTQYRDLVKVFYLMDKRLDQYLDGIPDMTEWQVCLCHGDLRDAHILQGERTFIINWEKASYQYPISDLVQFFRDTTKHFDNAKTQIIERFPVYMDENELSLQELRFLCIYLLDPSNYLQSVKEYVDRSSTRSMMEQVIYLQQLHRQLVFATSFSEFVEAEYEMVPFDESSSEG